MGKWRMRIGTRILKTIGEKEDQGMLTLLMWMHCDITVYSKINKSFFEMLRICPRVKITEWDTTLFF